MPVKLHKCKPLTVGKHTDRHHEMGLSTSSDHGTEGILGGAQSYPTKDLLSARVPQLMKRDLLYFQGMRQKVRRTRNDQVLRSGGD